SDVDDVARALAPVLVLDRMDDVVVPPHRVARLDPWDGDESRRRGGVPARIERQGVAGLGTAEVVGSDVGLQGSKDDPSHQIGDGDDLQRSVPGPLLPEGRPALEWATPLPERP